MDFPLGHDDIDARLWEYIDGAGTAEERSVIDKLIAADLEWKQKYQQLLDTQQLLKSAELEEPSMRFTKNIMEEISRYHIAPATKNYINKKIIWGIGAFFITIIVVFTVYMLSQLDWSSSGSNSALPVDIPRIDFSKMFNNTIVNIFMMLNVVLGLMFLDRYLDNKRKAAHKEA